MLKDLKQTGKHSAVYAIGNTITKLIGLILIPLYTNRDYLTPDEYGALAVLEATSQLLIGLLTMAMIQALTRWYWDKKYSDKQKGVFFTTIAFLFFIILPVSISLIFASEQISLLTLKTVSFAYLIKLVSISASITILNNQILCLAKLQSKSLLYISIQITKLSVTLSLILWGILKQGKGLEAIWEATLIGETIAFLALLPFTIKNIQFKFYSSILKEMILYGLPLMIAAISGVLLATMDRYMLSSMSSLENTGIYSLGYRIANTLKVIVTSSLALALSPLRMKKMNEPNHHRFYSKITTYSAFIYSFSVIGISLFSHEFLKFFAKDDLYWQANGIVPILAFAIFFGGLKDSVMVGITIKKKTKIIGSLIFTTSIINLILNLLLIPRLDIYGAALATLLSQTFFLASIIISAQKVYPIPYEWKKIFSIIITASVIIFVGYFITDLTLTARLAIKIALAISFPFILYLFNFYEKVEVENIKMIFQNWKDPRKFRENIRRLTN